MKTLKTISTAVMLITGILTALTGAVETIIKFIGTVKPKLESAPVRGESFKDLEQLTITPLQESFFSEWQGLFLLAFGVIVISISLIVIKRTK